MAELLLRTPDVVWDLGWAAIILRQRLERKNFFSFYGLISYFVVSAGDAASAPV